MKYEENQAKVLCPGRQRSAVSYDAAERSNEIKNKN